MFTGVLMIDGCDRFGDFNELVSYLSIEGGKNKTNSSPYWYLIGVHILNRKTTKNDHLTLSKKIEDGVDHTIVTCVASQLTSLATRDAGQRRVRPSVSRYIPRYVCNAMCRQTNDVVVRTFNLFLYFTVYPHNKRINFHKSNICLIEVQCHMSQLATWKVNFPKDNFDIQSFLFFCFWYFLFN